MRADALQNRQRVLAAADAMFREHGIDVSVGEIAEAAGVGRGTLFRNFRSKDHLIAAVVSERMNEALDAGRDMLANDPDDAEVIFTFIVDIAARQQDNRALLEVASDEFLAYPEMLAAHDAMLDLMSALLERGKKAGSVRPEIEAMDVVTLIKGMCMGPIALYELPPDVSLRYVDLIRAAITTPAFSRPLRGVPASPADLHPGAGQPSPA